MTRPKFVQIPSQPLRRFEPLLGEAFPQIEAAAEEARERFRGRAIWHVSSSLSGGGVAEMLRSLLPYVRGVGIDTRWVVLRESEEFFELTKRIHNNLHGDPGDGDDLDAAGRQTYEGSLAASAEHFRALLQPGDVVFLHDPQTAGLVAAVKATGATVVWRCHIGADEPNEVALRAQEFLAPYLRDADAWIFSRRQYFWPALDPRRSRVMAPSIDPFSPKNQDLNAESVAGILGTIGLGTRAPGTPPVFARADGTPGRVERRAEVIQERPLAETDSVLAEVSRWDRLKDHRGLLTCFERHLGEERLHLVLAGPAASAIADDPEGAAVWNEVRDAWQELPDPIRRRVHIASLPMDDLEENWAMVNAIQRRADIVVQKSIAEGFGLTVAEAMWKGKPVIGSRVGGIQDQIVDGVSGVLVDPTDLSELATQIRALHADPARAAVLGKQARERVTERFLGATRLAEYSRLLRGLEGGAG